VPDRVAFVVNGNGLVLTRRHVIAVMRNVPAEPIRSHSVVVGGQTYPVKQVFGLATGLDRLDFTSAIARRQLVRLGFEVSRS
jgi:hypothetical protein